MIELTLVEIATALDGDLLLPDDTSAVAAAPGAVGGHTVVGGTVVGGTVVTDSRLAVDGSIFFALPGETTDGHRFAGTAVDRGALLLVVERALDLPVAQIVVPNGVAALAALARLVVGRVRDRGELRVIGITGSNGKTTTKNLLRAVLSAVGPTVAPEGSFNNHVGAPLSMLALDWDTRFLVIEMGASAPGEIAKLVDIAIPDIAVVLKVGLAHAGVFGGIESTQRAKAEIVTRLPKNAIAVLNADDDRVVPMADQTDARIVWFGLEDRADPRALDVDAGGTGTGFVLRAGGEDFPVHLRILGEHHVMNALAALAVARELGLDLEAAIREIERVTRAERWRMELLDPGTGITVINDAYNASPDSMAAALKTLAQIGREGHRTVAVLGEMAELGEYAREEHDRIGRLVVRLGIGQLVVVGHEARHLFKAAELEGSWDGESVLVADADAAMTFLDGYLEPGDVVLVKSSKSAGLRFLGDRLGGLSS